jgi:hypothetical protein
MFTPELFRAKAAEYKELAKTVGNADQAREFERRERSFTVLADNEQWRVDHHEQTVLPVETGAGHDADLGLVGVVNPQATQ